MRHLEVLVEERSAAELFAVLIPRLIGEAATWDIREFSGKPDLLRKLPNRLAGYRTWSESVGLRVLVVVDRDDDDCVQLKADLDQAATSAGLSIKSHAVNFVVVNRIVVEELEAWYFGDVPALRALYPRLPESLGATAKYRDPDAIAGGTWESLERLLQRHGYERGGLRKTALAAAIAQHLSPDQNRSVSFRHFVEGLKAAAA